MTQRCTTARDGGSTVSGLARHMKLPWALRKAAASASLTFAAYVMPLICRLEADMPEVKILNYADDLVLSAQDGEQLQLAVNMVVDYANKVKLRLNADKSCYWLCGSTAARLPAALTVAGAHLPPQSRAEVLGASVAAKNTPL